MRRLFVRSKSAPSSPRGEVSTSTPEIRVVREKNREDRRVSDLNAKMQKALDVDDQHEIMRILYHPELSRNLMMYKFMELLAIRIGDPKLHPKDKEKAVGYFGLYSTELESDDVLSIAVTHLDTDQVLGYVSYCTKDGWERVMRAALLRQEPLITRYIWDIPERPRRQSLRKILFSFFLEVQKRQIPAPSFRYLLNLVNEKDGYVLVQLREDTSATGEPTLNAILDEYD